MQLTLPEIVLSAGILVIATWSALTGPNALPVILSGAVFGGMLLLIWRTPGREFFLLAAGQPLAVTVGISSLPAGILIQFLLIIILFAQDLSSVGIPVRATLLVVPAGSVAFALLFSEMTHLLVPFLALLVIAAVALLAISLQNRLLKRRYSGEES